MPNPMPTQRPAPESSLLETRDPRPETRDSRPATLGVVVDQSAARDPAHPALIFHDEVISYGELADRIARFAGGLHALGVRPGERVGLLVHNVPEFAVAFYGIARLGAVVVPLNVMLKPAEIAYILGDSQAVALVTVEPFLAGALEAAAKTPSIRHVIAATAAPQPDVIPWSRFAEAEPQPAYEEDPNEIAVIPYTSGTTGKPKGATLTHRNLIVNCEQCMRIERQKTVPTDRVLMVLPLFHIYGMNTVLNYALMSGATGVLLERFDPVATLETMQRHGVTILYGAPPMYVAWTNLPVFGAYDLSALRVAFSGAAPLPLKVLEAFRERTGIEIMEGYGLTETAPVVTSNARSPATRPGSVGHPIPGVEVRIVDSEGRDLPDGDVGELVCRGANVMSGYFQQDAATAEAMQGGWFHTGDLAYRDEDGYLYIVDRKKDMVLVGGFNVYPREVEEALYRHPKIADAAVVGVSDAYQGESVLALVVLKPGETATETEVIDWCRERIAVYKCPRHVEFRDELPKSLTGKVLRRVLRDEIRQQSAAPATAKA